MNYSTFKDRVDFQIREGRFILPEDTSNLDPKSKRAVTICNLFVNHHLNVSEIVRVLDEDHRDVLLVLINQGIINDRRRSQTKPPDGRDRRKPLLSPKVALRAPREWY